MNPSLYENFKPKIIDTDLEGKPQTSAEVAEIEAAQSSIGRTLPDGYREFLVVRNGYLGWIGKSYCRLYPTDLLKSESTPDWTEFFPGMLRIGDTGGLENLVINYNFSPPQFGLLPSIGDNSDFISLGVEWEQFVERLLNDSVFERDWISLKINNHGINVRSGTTVAAAVVSAGLDVFRGSVGGAPRGPLCGMGVCFECRVTIDGVRHLRSCNIEAADGMEVSTDD